MEEKAKKKLTVKGLLKALLVVLLILVILSLIIFLGGKYASSTAMDGLEKTDASILVLHSADDNVIGIEYGYDRYYEKYKDDPRFTFIRFEDRGHNEVFNDPDNTYIDEFNAEFDKWLGSLDYDYNAEENKERFKQDKAKYITENLDHKNGVHD